MESKLKIVFMGTPEFAVASLKAILDAGFEVAAVITAPDKPAGRGMKMQSSAVKQFAESQGLKIMQPPRLKNPEFIEELRALRANLFVVVAFRMLPEIVWNMPEHGTINVHGSLLPYYRGAAPINWAVINGEKQTGVTTFRLQHAIDTGNILLQDRLDIGENESAGELHDRMKEAGARLLVKTLQGIQAGVLEEKPQDTYAIAAGNIRHAPKIFTETSEINWNQDVRSIHNLVRGLSPFPGAFTHLNGKTFKIYKAYPELSEHDVIPGTWASDHKDWLRFAAKDGYLYVQIVQPEGKKRMETADFLRGWRP